MFSLIAAVVPHGETLSDAIQFMSKHKLNYVISTKAETVVGFVNGVSFSEDENAKIPSNTSDQAKRNLISLNIPMATELLVPPGFEDIVKEIGKSQSQVNETFSSTSKPHHHAIPVRTDENRQDPKQILCDMTSLPEEHQQSLSNKQVPLNPVPTPVDHEKPQDVFESASDEPFGEPLPNSDELQVASMTTPVMPPNGTDDVFGGESQIQENTAQNPLVSVNGSNASDGQMQNPIVSDAYVPSDEIRQDVNMKNSRVDMTPLSKVKKEVLEPVLLLREPRNIFDAVKTEPFDRPLLNPNERNIDITMDSDEAERVSNNSGPNDSTRHSGHVSQVVFNNIPFRSDDIHQDMNSPGFGVFMDSTDFNDSAPESKVKEEVQPPPSRVQVNPRPIDAVPTEMDLFHAANDEPVLTVEERDVDVTMDIDDMPEGILKTVKLEPFDKSLINPDETEVDLMDDEDCGDLDEQADPKDKKATPKRTKKMPGKSVSSKKAKKNGCDVCDKTFSCPSQLLMHYRVHNGEKPFECKVCQKMFSQKGTLKTHMRVHTGEKPYECDVCQKKFAHRSDRNKHMRIHNGGEPYYDCKECHKKFTQKRYLQRHNNRYHP